MQWPGRNFPLSPPSYRGTSLIRNASPQDPTVGLCVWPYGGPSGGGAFYYERGGPVHSASTACRRGPHPCRRVQPTARITVKRESAALCHALARTGRPAPTNPPYHRVSLSRRLRKVEYDPFIKGQLASSNWLLGLLWCKYGHVLRGIPRCRNPRTPPSGTTGYSTQRTSKEFLQ